MPFKKDLTPLTSKGDIVKHRGKGSSQEPLLPRRGAIPRAPANSMNDFSKATPNLAQSAAGPGMLNGGSRY